MYIYVWIKENLTTFNKPWSRWSGISPCSGRSCSSQEGRRRSHQRHGQSPWPGRTLQHRKTLPESSPRITGIWDSMGVAKLRNTSYETINSKGMYLTRHDYSNIYLSIYINIHTYIPHRSVGDGSIVGGERVGNGTENLAGESKSGIHSDPALVGRMKKNNCCTGNCEIREYKYHNSQHA